MSAFVQAAVGFVVALSVVVAVFLVVAGVISGWIS